MRIIRPIVLLALLALFVGSLWEGIQKTDLLKLKAIQITGAAPTTEARLRKNITITPGDSLWEKSVEKQAEIAKRDPWVEKAQVRRVFPNTIVIDVKERTPFAVMNESNGQFKYLDSSNTIIDKAEPEKIGQYPILVGHDLRTNSNLRGEALDILKSLPEDGLMSRHDVSDLRFDEEHGFQMRLAKSGILIDIGKENIPLHIDRARRVVQYLDQHSINASRVDSDYSKKVLVKVRKGR
jgi:cell division septal protein FtsQ